MYILGINAYHGDSSACILKDGLIIAAAEEERFKRVKHWAGFPSEAIAFCLQEAEIKIEDLDHVTISRDPKANLSHKILHTLKNKVGVQTVFDRITNSRKVGSVKAELVKNFSVAPEKIKAEFHNIEHHRSHIASAFFASKFKNSAILSIDGFGDFTSTMTAIGDKNRFDVLDSVIYPHSLGVFYTAVTQFLGFPNYGDEYKVMGLSPYGHPKFLKQFEEVLKISNGFFKLNEKYFTHFKDGVAMDWDQARPSISSLFTIEWEVLFGKARAESDKLEKWHIDLATSAQKYIEQVIFHILNELQKKTGSENICITGGVAQNSVVNGKILENTDFKQIYIPSAGHDAGTSIGSALYLYNQVLGKGRLPEITSAYFGSKFNEDQIIRVLEEANISYRVFTDEELFERVSDKLINGGVIGWFQGRAEFGPRALGNRSILVDPRRSDAKDLLNEKIKRRESFRPFAPSILKEAVSEFFVQNDVVPFMEKVFDIKKEKQDKIPAVTHVDGTGRLQTVDKNISPRYYKLISTFSEKTGVPILLNTSFNENEPIVNKPEEALDCFLRTKMDMLVMGNTIVER